MISIECSFLVQSNSHQLLLRELRLGKMSFKICTQYGKLLQELNYCCEYSTAHKLQDFHMNFAKRLPTKGFTSYSFYLENGWNIFLGLCCYMDCRRRAVGIHSVLCVPYQWLEGLNEKKWSQKKSCAGLYPPALRIIQTFHGIMHVSVETASRPWAAVL